MRTIRRSRGSGEKLEIDELRKIRSIEDKHPYISVLPSTLLRGMGLGCLLFPILSFIAGGSVLASGQPTLVFTSERAWRIGVSDVEEFLFTSNNVGAADEVGGPPIPEMNLGPLLSFQAANTGLSRSFTLMALNEDWLFEDRLVPESLSPGAIDPPGFGPFEDDDFRADFTGGPPLTAFGFYLDQNEVSMSETLTVFGPNGEVIGSMPLVLNRGDQFYGVVSTVPITAIEVDEASDGEDITIGHFFFGSAGKILTDETGWRSSPSIGCVEGFLFTGANIGAADEVAGPPAPESNIGSTLTFQAENTTLSRSFSARSLNDDWVFEDRFIAQSLSPGAIDPPGAGPHEDDDFRVEVTDGPTLNFFGFSIDQNEVSASETVTVFGPGGCVLLSAPLVLTVGTQFYGVVSAFPITAIEVDEGRDGEDIVIRDFLFASGVEVDVKAGNVNAGAGCTTDVLFLNGSSGVETNRTIDLDINSEPFVLSITGTPLDPTNTKYCVYLWSASPTGALQETLPSSVGVIGLPTVST